MSSILNWVFAGFFNIINLLGLTHPACQVAAEGRLEVLPQVEAQSKVLVCSLVAFGAEGRGMSVPLVVELSWAESGWEMFVTNTNSKCWGVLQVQPYFWCPQRNPVGCNPITAGLDAVTTYLKLHPKDPAKALCHYNSGNVCTNTAHRWAKTVVQRTKMLEAQMLAREASVQVALLPAGMLALE